MKRQVCERQLSKSLAISWHQYQGTLQTYLEKTSQGPRHRFLPVQKDIIFQRSNIISTKLLENARTSQIHHKIRQEIIQSHVPREKINGQRQEAKNTEAFNVSIARNLQPYTTFTTPHNRPSPDLQRPMM